MEYLAEDGTLAHRSDGPAMLARYRADCAEAGIPLDPGVRVE